MPGNSTGAADVIADFVLPVQVMMQQMSVKMPQVEFVEVLPVEVAAAAVGVVPFQKNEKQEKAKLPRQGGPVPERGSEKQDTAKLPRQGGQVGKVKGEVPEGMEQQCNAVPRFGVGLAPHAERGVPVDVAHAVDAHAVEQEIIVGGMPATSTIQFVTGIFGKLRHGTVVSCERRFSTRPGFGVMYKLRLATAHDAEWCIKTLCGSEKAATLLGLESPIFVDSFVDSGWMWKT
jgi:hypothetical protein